MGFRHLFRRKSSGQGDISHYAAISTILAGNFGTGNISGMAVAIATGGPGALVWMWVMTFLAAAIQYASALLGVKYRKKDQNGQYVGGPMYYISEGLGFKKMGMLFAVVTILAAFSVGNFVQINSMTLPMAALGVSPLIASLILAVGIGLVVLGGALRIARVSAAVVPFMSLLYFGTALFILALHSDALLPAFGLMFKSALGVQGIVGGALGFTVMKAVTTGITRSIFATDAGTGMAPLLQSGAKTEHPVIDGVVTLVAPFFVMIVCTATSLVLIVTGAFSVEGLKSTNMVTHAFTQGLGSDIGAYVVIFSLLLFGYTTTLAWASCMEKAVTYLFGSRFVKYFMILYIFCVPMGALMQVDLIWILADLTYISMLLVNLIGVTGLAKEVTTESKQYFKKTVGEQC